MGCFRRLAGIAGLCAAFVAVTAEVRAQDAFYKGKRLTVLVNYAPGGSTDAEARVFVRHIGRVLEGQPAIIIQNMEGAGGFVGAKYVGEVAPRDSTLAGYFTATAFLAALEPERFKVDFKSYEFIGIQAGTSINFVRTDVSPGMKEPADLLKAKGLVVGSLAPDSPKGIRLRLGFDLLGLSYKFIPGYRSGGAAKLALERGEINVYGESPPSYFSIIEPGLVKSGTAIPLYMDSNFDGQNFFIPESAKNSPVAPFHEFYQKVKGEMPSGQIWEAYKGMVAPDGRTAGRGPGIARRADSSQRRQGLCGGRAEGVRIRADLAGRGRQQCSRGAFDHAGCRDEGLSAGLHQESAAVSNRRRPDFIPA
jgi:hypothetical protein